MIKVAFCTDGIFPHAVGGMQRHSRLLLEALAEYQDLEIHVLHPHDKKIFEDHSNIKEIYLQGIDPKNNYLKECRAYSKRVYNYLKSGTFDVIYSQGLSVWHRASEFSDKLIVNPHGLEPFQAIGFKNKLLAIPFKRVFKVLFKQSKYVVSLGGRLTGILKNIIPEDKILVLPNAANLPSAEVKYNPPDQGPLRLMFVARFAKNKGIHILIRAIEELNEEGYNDKLFFDLAGKGPLYEKYKTGHQKDNIKYWGFISDEDLDQLYKESHGFVFPTLFEGMPTVVLEAMSYGKPVIVSDTGATAELVDRSNGYLIEKNNVRQLKEAVLDFLTLGNNKKEELSYNSYKKVKENFIWPKVAEKHYEVFRQFI